MRVRTGDGLELALGRRGPDRSVRDPVLLVHGFGGAGAAWGARVLDGLAHARPTLAIDLIGHGRSDDPDGPERVRLERVLDDLERALDAVEVERCVWVGYSMGGRIALAAAVQRPERVSRLVLESASPGLASEPERAARRAQDEARAERIERLGVDAWAEEWEREPLFARRGALPDAVREPFLELRRANRAASLAAWLRGFGAGTQEPLWDRLRGVRPPVLCITGSEDERYTGIARAMAAEMTSARHVVVPGAGHTVHLEQPEAWLAAVTAFLDEPVA